MSTTIDIQLNQDDTGLTLVAKMIQPGGAQVGADVALTEHVSTAGHYSAAVPTPLAAGDYLVAVFEGNVQRGQSQLYWDGTQFTDRSQGRFDLLLKYHDNLTKFYAADGTTETTQAAAYFMAVFDDDETTELKRIGFQNGSGTGVTLANATRYVTV